MLADGEGMASNVSDEDPEGNGQSSYTGEDFENASESEPRGGLERLSPSDVRRTEEREGTHDELEHPLPQELHAGDVQGSEADAELPSIVQPHREGHDLWEGCPGQPGTEAGQSVSSGTRGGGGGAAAGVPGEVPGPADPAPAAECRRAAAPVHGPRARRSASPRPRAEGRAAARGCIESLSVAAAAAAPSAAAGNMTADPTRRLAEVAAARVAEVVKTRLAVQTTLDAMYDRLVRDCSSATLPSDDHGVPQQGAPPRAETAGRAAPDEDDVEGSHVPRIDERSARPRSTSLDETSEHFSSPVDTIVGGVLQTAADEAADRAQLSSAQAADRTQLLPTNATSEGHHAGPVVDSIAEAPRLTRFASFPQYSLGAGDAILDAAELASELTSADATFTGQHVEPVVNSIVDTPCLTGVASVPQASRVAGEALLDAAELAIEPTWQETDMEMQPTQLTYGLGGAWDSWQGETSPREASSVEVLASAEAFEDIFPLEPLDEDTDIDAIDRLPGHFPIGPSRKAPFTLDTPEEDSVPDGLETVVSRNSDNVSLFDDPLSLAGPTIATKGFPRTLTGPPNRFRWSADALPSKTCTPEMGWFDPVKIAYPLPGKRQMRGVVATDSVLALPALVAGVPGLAPLVRDVEVQSSPDSTASKHSCGQPRASVAAPAGPCHFVRDWGVQVPDATEAGPRLLLGVPATRPWPRSAPYVVLPAAPRATPLPGPRRRNQGAPGSPVPARTWQQPPLPARAGGPPPRPRRAGAGTGPPAAALPRLAPVAGPVPASGGGALPPARPGDGGSPAVRAAVAHAAAAEPTGTRGPPQPARPVAWEAREAPRPSPSRRTARPPPPEAPTSTSARMSPRGRVWAGNRGPNGSEVALFAVTA